MDSGDALALVTRPAGQADDLLAGLRAQGFATLHWPMLAIEPIDPLPGATRQRLLDLDRYDHLLFVSANAALIGLQCIDDYWPQRPAQQQYWAVGASTARTLAAQGIRAGHPENDMSSEGLLAMDGLAQLEGQRVAIIKGEGGRELLAKSLRERGATVDSIELYRRGPVAYDPASCRERIGRGGPLLILVSSGEGLEHLTRLLHPHEHTNLADATLVVPSPRVAEQARQLGWLHVERAENASDSAMLSATQRWRSTHPGEIQSIEREDER